MENLNQSYRSFIWKLALATVTLSLVGNDAYSKSAHTLSVRETSVGAFTSCAFPKIFDQLGKGIFPFLAGIVFGGIDLTVHSSGRVLPESKEKDLPKAINAEAKKGLSVPLISIAISEASEATTRKILKTVSECCIKYYSTDWFMYDNSLGIKQNLNVFRKRQAGLCELNVKYGLLTNFQNHDVFNNHLGGIFDFPVLNFWTVIKDMDSRYMGCQYDIHHAVEGGFTSWQLALKVVRPRIETVSVKDFILEKKDGKYAVKTVPMGIGVVDFEAFFKPIRDKRIAYPIYVFFEFTSLDKRDKPLSVNDKMKESLSYCKIMICQA